MQVIVTTFAFVLVKKIMQFKAYIFGLKVIS